MKNHYVLGYGMFCDPFWVRQTQFVSRARYADMVPVGYAKIKDATLSFDMFAYASRQKGEHIYGTIYRVSNEMLDALDHIEGYPTHYDRQKFNVEHVDADSVAKFAELHGEAEVYLPKSVLVYVSANKVIRSKPHRIGSDYIRRMLHMSALYGDAKFSKMIASVSLET